MSTSKLLTSIEGVPPSAEIRATLAAEGRPVIVSFSAGKDAICTELALREAGVATELVYLYYIPGLRFVDEGLSSLEDQLDKKVHRFPHPSLYRWLRHGIFQTPERARVIEAAQLTDLSYEQVWELVREHLDMDPDTWLADGVRANDSQQRRMAFTRYGAMKEQSHKVSPIWDWSIAAVRQCLEGHKITLPIDYEWFGRSFDGLDRRFTDPIREHAPNDFERIREWFPLVDMEAVRHGL